MEKVKNTAKRYIGTGIIGSMLTFITMYVDNQLGAVERDIESKHQMVVKYVDDKHIQVKDDLNDIKRMLERIDKRVYDLNQNKEKQ